MDGFYPQIWRITYAVFVRLQRSQVKLAQYSYKLNESAAALTVIMVLCGGPARAYARLLVGWSTD